MLKKDIKYTDFDGNEREESFYFNLTRAELLEMQLSENGGLQTLIQKIISEQDSKKITSMFKKIILKAYGEKSTDGKHFMKSEEISHNFECTEAYSKLFCELATNAEAAAAFVNGIVPADISGEMKKIANK